MNEGGWCVRANSNWNASGCDLDNAIQTRITHEDIYIRPELNEILSEKYAVLLTRPTNGQRTSCELQIAVNTRYKIASLTFVCSASKVEIFFGSLMEYIETIYGALISDQNDEPLSYRYDIEIEKSGVVELTVKMPTTAVEICFFGILLDIAPNPNGVTTLVPNAINLENVQQMLDNSNQKLSPGAEKCRMFMQMFNKGASPMHAVTSGSSSNALLEEMRQMLHSKSHSSQATSSSIIPPPTLDNVLKAHIDLRMKELEQTIQTRLDDYEKQQSYKLDKILQLLETTLDNVLKTHIDLRMKELEQTIQNRLDNYEKQQSDKLDNILHIFEKKM